MKRKLALAISLVVLLTMAALSLIAAFFGPSTFFLVLAGLFLVNAILFVVKPRMGFVFFLILSVLLLGWQFATMWNVVNEGWVVMDPVSKGMSLLPLVLSVALCALGVGSISNVARQSGA
jgi:hypothetical protein